ncbi:flagellar export protein FliJ [Thermovenabulum sp.]|uniref:flagellar export protein FliJ n=1 Tax=Thermovenabulum sp. TaxID=3100335 RepID=UPI003C7DBB20
MKKFKFKLEKLLNAKTVIENLKKEELFKAKKRLEEEKYALDYLEGIKNEILLQSPSRQVDSVKAYELINFDNFYRRVSELIYNQRKKVEESQRMYDCSLNEFLNAKREKRILEVLKDKRFKLFLEEYAKQEQKNLDEHAIIAFSRRDE